MSGYHTGEPDGGDRAGGQTSSDPNGVRDPAGPITLTVTRAQAWDLYDLIVARARTVESAEEDALCGLGSKRYRDAAEVLRAALDAR